LFKLQHSLIEAKSIIERVSKFKESLYLCSACSSCPPPAHSETTRVEERKG
jgi:hypothetical protein